MNNRYVPFNLKLFPFRSTFERRLTTIAFGTLLLCVLFGLNPSTSHAQETGSIEGTVTSAEDDGPLEAVSVVIAALQRGAATDRDGRFSIRNVPVGTYEIAVSYIGRSVQRSEVTVEAGQTATVDFVLTPEDMALDEMVVSASPITGSQAAAISRQRAAPVITNVVASDVVGKFPDQNAAAALSRVPGIAVERDQGQARYINLRGTPRRWTTLAFDGINVIGSEGRIVRFDEIPAPIIQSIEVTKAISPDLPAESVAGRVNVQTASAFDRPGLHMTAEAAPGYFDLGGDLQYNAFVQVSNTWGDKVGVVATATRYERNQVTDNIESQYTLSSNGELFPNTSDFRVYYLERTNNAFSGRFDYRPSPQHELFLTSTFVEFNDDEQRNQYIFNLGDAPAGFMEGGSTPDQGTVQGVPMLGALGPGYYRNDTWTTLLGGTSLLNRWTLDYRASYTRTSASQNLPVLLPLYAGQPFVIGYDYRDPNFPGVDLSTLGGDPVANIPQSNPAADLAFIFRGEDEANAYASQLDANFDWTFLEREASFQVGTKIDVRDKRGFVTNSQIVPLGALLSAAGQPAVDYSPFIMDEGLAGEFPFPNRFQVQRVDVFGLENVFNQRLRLLEEAGLYDPAGVVPDENRFDVRESIYAGYLMNEWETSFGNVLAGVRVEHAAFDSEGFRVLGDVVEPVDASTSETFLFPSLHVNADLTERLKLRVAGTSTVSRADFAQRRPSVSIDDVNNRIAGGNPTAGSERSWGADLRLEYYLPRAGSLSIAGFSKWVRAPLFTTSTVVEDNRFDTEAADRTGYLYATTVNGTDGRLYGVEADYFQQWTFLPGPLAGFGLQANATLIDSEFTTPVSASGEVRTARFPGTSDATYNISLFFERYGLSARVNYQWRDDWLQSLDPADGRFDTVWDDEKRLSVSARYAISNQLTLFADANNLTNELGRRYQGFENRPVEVEGFGRSYLLGLRVNL
jgi:TonB-dependent receptor